MDWGIFIPIAAIIIGPIAWVASTWIRARHGYPIKDGKNLVHPSHSEAGRQIDAICAENQELKTTVTKLEDRLKVLERIATDPSRRLSDQIDELQ